MWWTPEQASTCLATGEVPTKGEATVYVRELDLFVTVMLLEDTPAVLSLGNLCEDPGYSHEWTSGQKPHLTQNGRRKKCNTANYVPIVVPGLSTGSSISSSPTTPTSSSQETAAQRIRFFVITMATTQRLVVNVELGLG